MFDGCYASYSLVGRHREKPVYFVNEKANFGIFSIKLFQNSQEEK